MRQIRPLVCPLIADPFSTSSFFVSVVALTWPSKAKGITANIPVCGVFLLTYNLLARAWFASCFSEATTHEELRCGACPKCLYFVSGPRNQVIRPLRGWISLEGRRAAKASWVITVPLTFAKKVQAETICRDCTNYRLYPCMPLPNAANSWRTTTLQRKPLSTSTMASARSSR